MLAGEVPARSPGAFDMSGVGGSLAESVGSPPPAATPTPTPPTRKTPESFLGPNAALVDLDSLVSRPGPTPPGSKASNPFLPSGECGLWDSCVFGVFCGPYRVEVSWSRHASPHLGVYPRLGRWADKHLLTAFSLCRSSAHRPLCHQSFPASTPCNAHPEPAPSQSCAPSSWSATHLYLSSWWRPWPAPHDAPRSPSPQH